MSGRHSQGSPWSKLLVNITCVIFSRFLAWFWFMDCWLYQPAHCCDLLSLAARCSTLSPRPPPPSVATPRTNTTTQSASVTTHTPHNACAHNRTDLVSKNTQVDPQQKHPRHSTLLSHSQHTEDRQLCTARCSRAPRSVRPALLQQQQQQQSTPQQSAEAAA